MRNLLIGSLLLLMALPTVALTFGPAVRAQCPVDGAWIQVRPVKSRLHRPIVHGGPDGEPFYSCPSCFYTGVADDFLTPAGPWTAELRSRASAWLRTVGAGLSVERRSAGLADVLKRPALERAKRHTLAGQWNEAMDALREVPGSDAIASRCALAIRAGDAVEADRLLKLVRRDQPSTATLLERARAGMGPAVPNKWD